MRRQLASCGGNGMAAAAKARKSKMKARNGISENGKNEMCQ